MKLAVAAFAVFTFTAAVVPADASPVVVTNPALFATAGMVSINFEDIVVPPGGTVPITNQYASDNLTFSPGLHTDTAFPALAPAILGGVAASNGDPGCCPSITMNFLGGGASRVGFDLISLDPAVTEVDVFTILNGVSTFAGTLVLDTALEIKFFGIIADPNDPSANFDSLVLTTLLGPNQPSGFIMDNVQFVPVPEPATLSLLGVGALAGMLRRNRRTSRRPAL